MSNFDPNLREAVEEIRAICKRRNIGANIFLASETHSEYAELYDAPAWSVLSFEDLEDGGKFVRIKATPSVFPEDKDRLTATIAMLYIFRDLLANSFLKLDQTLIPMIDKHFDVTHESRVGKDPDSWPGKKED